MVSHPRYNVRVGIQRDGDVSVPEEFLNVLRMDVASEEQRCAGVPQVVEADRRNSCPLQQRSERAQPQVGWIYEGTGCLYSLGCREDLFSEIQGI